MTLIGGTRKFKQCPSMRGTHKTKSPSLNTHSSSPHFSSASNSPVLNCTVSPRSNSSSMTSSYAPVVAELNVQMDRKSKNKKLHVSNQSKNMTSSHRKQKNMTSSGHHASLSAPKTLTNVSPRLRNNSSSISSSSQSISPTLPSSTIQSTAANKRLHKKGSYTISSPEIEILTPDPRIGNGRNEPVGKVSTAENVFVNSANSRYSETGKASATKNSKSGKRKRCCDKDELLETRLGDVLASLPSGSKHPKVKTTQELIADLQAKKGLITAFSPNSFSSNNPLYSSEAEVSQTKSELMKKFLNSSQSAKGESHQLIIDSRGLVGEQHISNSRPDVPSVINTNLEMSSSTYRDPVDEEIKNILSALPPINMDEINLEEDYPLPNQSSSLADDFKKLEKPWEYVNGNYDCHGNWKGWQECTEQRSYLGENFPVLPYVNID